MAALLIGYARCSTDQQDLTAQRDGLSALGVADGRVYVDHGLTGTNRERPGLREALAACREGDTLVVTKLDRLAGRCRTREPSLTNSQCGRFVLTWVDRCTTRRTRSAGCCSTCSRWSLSSRIGPDSAAHQGGLKVAKAKGRLRGKQPKLNRRQEAHLVALLKDGEYSTAEPADLFGVARSTVYRAVERERLRAIVGVGSTVG